MARPLRIEYRGAYYHVMNRGLSRRDIFLENTGRDRFLDLVSDISRLWKIEIYAYCLPQGQEGVQRLIAGPEIHICNECVDLSSDLINEALAKDRGN